MMLVEGFIEPATPEDLDDILELQKAAFRTEGERYRDFSIPPLVETKKEIRQSFKKQLFFKYMIGPEIVGTIRGYIDERCVCLIGRLAVRLDFRRRGIARRLMDHIMEYFKDCREFEIFTGEKSYAVIALYESLGFTHKKTKNAGTHNLVIMTKPNTH